MDNFLVDTNILIIYNWEVLEKGGGNRGWKLLKWMKAFFHDNGTFRNEILSEFFI